MNKIYIVRGETGEWDDRREWSVCAFLDKTLAEERAQKAQAEADKLLKNDGKFNGEYLLNNVNIFDPHFDMDYNGTKYTVEELEFIP